jgi:hypothetical protein
MSGLSEKALAIGKSYLGPAAESFLARQCSAHLKVDFKELSKDHLKDLSKWVEVGAGLLIDPPKAAEMAKRISLLS